MLPRHPYQLALMGFWLDESPHEDLPRYVEILETYTAKLQEELDKLREENEELRRKLSSALREKDETRRAFQIYTALQGIKRAAPGPKAPAVDPNGVGADNGPVCPDTAAVETIRRFREDVERLLRFLAKFFGPQDNPFLTSRGMAHREKLLRYVRYMTKQLAEIF